MAKEQQEVNVQKIGTVIHTDSSPIEQPKGTHRFALNAVNEVNDGNQGNLSNEGANYSVDALDSGYFPLGDVYIGDDLNVVINIDNKGGEQIGVIDKDNKYTGIVYTSCLKLSSAHQCDVIFRLRRGSERIIYWVDGLNRARTFNLDRPHNFYNNAYKQYLKSGGNPDSYNGEKWDSSSFDLIKSYKSIPFFADVKIIETGNIVPGSYNFAVQYVDEDLNPTEWITTSNPVRIYNDTVNNAYERIRGSKNIHSSAQQFDRANKSIKLTISNLDSEFPYYRVAIIRAAGLNGLPDKVFASDLYSTSDSNFTYTGNDSQLTELSLGDILIDREIIYAPKHIEQIENRLVLANTKGKGINWCDFQRYASKIDSDLVTKEVSLNNVLSEANIKNAKSSFIYRGYMPGEVHSFGIAYLFDDGYVSPVFHIPGRSATHPTSKMKVYEGDTRYLDIHNCSTDNYWGKDSQGETLVGKKIRHHRFPFRKEVNKPLVTSTTTSSNINKYKLTLTISLAAGKTYPVDGTGAALPINYTINYRVSNAVNNVQFSNILTDTELNIPITIYDDVNELQAIFNTNVAELEATSQLATQYMVSGTEVFVLTYGYTSYVASTSINDDKAELFGIQFNGIERPHPNVVGFYIVRNERTEDDRIIVDNAVVGPMTEYEQYKSFGLVTPKQFYVANNCGYTNDSGKTLKYFNKGVWLFNPEFQFFNKKTDFDHIEVEGVYSEVSVDMPTISDREYSSCNVGDGGTKGVYINDVQAGTTYNPEVNKKKDKDDDGFDLVIGYRNTNFSFTLNNTLVFPTKRLVVHLNAASYHNMGVDTFYNVSTDNKISQFVTDTPLSNELLESLHNTATNKNGLIYGALVKDNTSCYANFINKPYYKEHNNPIFFGPGNTPVNGVSIFNGDAEISALHLVSSVFYDIVTANRSKKSKVWKIVVGSVLVIAAVAATILTAGAAAPLAAAAISYGISMITSGIKFEQFKAMIDTDYEKGLKETVVDGGVYECIRTEMGRWDDTIRWFSDRASNIYIESSVPFGLRSGITAGVSDFIDAPVQYNEETFRSYLTEKFTTLDRDQGQGRLYKGYAGAEFYDVNKDYMRMNKEKQFSHLPVEYDCCSDFKEEFPLRRWVSEQSFQEEKVDNYRIFLPNNYSDMEGEHGEITGLYKFANNLFVTTKEALWQQPANIQERVTGEIVSFIGTGDFFSIPPKRIVDDTLGSGGTQHKWATLKTQFGVVMVNEIKNKIYLHGEGLKDITVGNRNWFKENLTANLTKQLYDKFGIKYKYDNNPANPNGIGYLSAYDSRHERVLITKKDYRILQEKLDGLVVLAKKPTNSTTNADSVYNSVYGSVYRGAEPMLSYSLEDGLFYLGNDPVSFDNKDVFENRSWTISYSFHSGGFVSLHSYLPNYYIYSQSNLYSFISGSDSIWKHNQKDKVQTFYGRHYPHIIELVLVSNPLVNKTLEDITFQTVARKWNNVTKSYYDVDATFNKITVSNTRQSTGEQEMVVKQQQPNPQHWYKQQTVNTPGIILLERSKTDWNINNIRDYVVGYDKPLVSSNWEDIKDEYPIDKVVNTDTINFAKPWSEVQVLEDKYAVIRLKFDNFNDVVLSFNYIINTEPLNK